MEQLNIDTGIQEYCINGKSVLRFNPSDPNLYGRFLEAVESIKTIEHDLTQSGKELAGDGKKTLELILQADKDTKSQLTKVFGEENDFNELLGDVNLMAVCANGERVITNLFEALSPILEMGAQTFLQAKANQTLMQAQQRRKARQSV